MLRRALRPKQAEQQLRIASTHPPLSSGICPGVPGQLLPNGQGWWRRHRHETEGFCRRERTAFCPIFLAASWEEEPGQPLVEVNTQLSACLLFFYRAPLLDTALASRRTKRPKRDLPAFSHRQLYFGLAVSRSAIDNADSE